MLAGDIEVQSRAAEVERLLQIVCGDEEFPWFVSDEATVFDVCSLSEQEIASALSESYGRPVGLSQLRLPIWKLVDELS